MAAALKCRWWMFWLPVTKKAMSIRGFKGLEAHRNQTAKTINKYAQLEGPILCKVDYPRNVSIKILRGLEPKVASFVIPLKFAEA
jgi:hypothetical protein